MTTWIPRTSTPVTRAPTLIRQRYGDRMVRGGRGPCAAARRSSILAALLCAVSVPAASRAETGRDPAWMPHAFDRPLVERLIQAIDDAHNATILTHGYFGRRVAWQFPQREGYALLTGACGAIVDPTRRWFLLQSLRGYAAFRVGADIRREGYDAYDAVFSRPEDAEKAGAVDIVERAMFDYSFTMQGNYGVRQFRAEAKASDVLLRAFSAQLKFLKDAQLMRYDVPWARVMRATYAGGPLFENPAEAALKDPGMPRTLALFVTVAGVLQRGQPKRALAVLLSARSLLTGQNPVDVVSFEEHLFETARDAGDGKSAIEAQREIFRITGHGQARLAVLYRSAGDSKSYHDILESLSKPGGSETEMNQLAVMLAHTHDSKDGKDKPSEDAVQILTSYLAGERTREVEQELLARLTLAGVLIEKRQTDQARAVAAAAPAIGTSGSPAAHAYARDLQALLARLPVVSHLSSRETDGKDTRR